MSNFKKLLIALVVLTTSTAAAFKYSGIKHDITSTASSGGTLTLTSASNQVRQITGVLTHTVVLPAANTLSTGYWYIVSNDSTGTVTVQDNGLNTLYSVNNNQSATFYVVDASTANGVWDVQKGESGISQLTGDVTAGPGSGSQAATIANDAVSNAKMANMNAATVKGRATGAGTGDPTDLSDAQVAAILDSYFVDQTTAEVIGGVKTFTSMPLMSAGVSVQDHLATGEYTSIEKLSGGAGYTLRLPATAGTTGQVLRAAGTAPGVVSLEFATASGGGSGGGLWGIVSMEGVSNCRWSLVSQANNSDFGADSDCSDPTPTDGAGDASAPATKIPAITFANMEAGIYKFTAIGDFLFDPGASNVQCAWRFSDGTRASGNQINGNNGTEQDHVPVITGYITYLTDQANQTIKIQSGLITGASGNCDIINSLPGQAFQIIVEKIHDL